MVEALQYTHDAGYVHADIKSANILLKNNSKEVKQEILWKLLSTYKFHSLRACAFF